MKRFLKKGIFVLLSASLLLFPRQAASRNTVEALRDKLDAARSLYYNGAFPAAEQAFSALAIEAEGSDYLTRAEIEAYRVLCNISMDRVNAEWSLKVFADKYPNAPQMPMLQFRLASRLFDRCEYGKAAPIFDAIRENDLYSDWRIEFRFKRAFCRMRANRRADAAEGFKSVADAPRNPYTYPAIYYLGYVKYLDRDFAGAVPLFEKASADSRFRLMSGYYCLESRFLQNDYDYVISKGPALYETLPADLKANVARILSESCFRKGDSEKAAVYLDKLRGSSAGFSRRDRYFSGFLAYSMGQYEKALADFADVPGLPDSLTQNAWYRMADCHLKRGNRNAALNAFRNASEIDADQAVKEDAFFNYARLCFDLNADFSKFEAYLKAFPESGKDDIINGYLAASYILSKDYGSAVNALRKINSPTRESVSNLQKAAFLRAMQLVSSGSCAQALPMLELSEANGRYDGNLALESSFWRAECLYRTRDYAGSQQLLKKLIADPQFRASDRYPQSLVTLAYCHLKQQEYAEAIGCFDRYLALGDDMPLVRDAALRKADACYRSGDYPAAAAAYDAARLKYKSDDLYPVLRAAVSYGQSGDVDRKVELLSQVRDTRRNSPLYSNVLLELGRTYNAKGNSREASDCFEDILTMRGDSSCFSAALLEMALLCVNSSENERALRYYKRIVEDCPLSEELPAAISGMESVYQAMNRPDDFLAYLDEVGMSATRDESHREDLLFSSGETLYRQGNFGRAVVALQKYITEYPDNSHTTEAYYMLGESLCGTGRREAALKNYHKAMQRGGDRQICEAATLAYAKLSYQMEKYSQAAVAYGSLMQMGVSENMFATACAGRMRCNYRICRWDDVLSDWTDLSERASGPASILREGRYLAAKSLIVKGDRNRAMEHLQTLSGDCSDVFGAEASYLLIFDAYNNGEYARVEEMVYRFSDSGTGQLYWLARSFLVLGDAFLATGDTARAEEQYRSLIDSYAPASDDGIKAEASEKLAKLLKEGGR